MKKHISKIVGLSLGIAMAIGVGVGIATSNRTTMPVRAEEIKAYTLDGTITGSGNSYANNNSATVDGLAWTVQGNAQTSPWRLGGKLASATDRAVYSNASLSSKTTEDISKVVVTLGTKQTEITVNSVTIKVGNSANSNNVSTETISADVNASNAVITFNRPAETSWASKYFSFVLNLSSSDSANNKYVQFSKAEFYYEGSGGGGDPTTLDAPTGLSASGTVLSWTNVENNNGYSYSINTTPVATTGDIAKDATSFDAAQLQLDAGTYSFSLKANGDGASYDDSDYCSGVSFTMPDYAIDTFDVDDFAATDTGYTEFSISGTSGANYVGFSARPNGTNTGYFQFNNNGTPKSRGIATSETCGYIRKVGITWGNDNSKALTVYVGNTPYSSSANLNTGTAQLATLSASNTMVTVSGDYKYVSLLPNGAVYPATISFYWEQVTFTQNLSATAVFAYKNETITVSTDATNPVTWSIVNGAGTTATGAAVTPAGVVSVTGAGTVTVKAVSNSYNDAAIQLTFNEPPANVYAVTFNSNGGSESPAVENVADGDTFEFPSAGTKEHYSFDGWTSTGSEPYYAEGETSPAVTANITYTAHWTEDAKYTVTYTADSNGSGFYAHTNNYGGSYELLPFNSLTGVSAADGYRFKNYTVNGINKNPGDAFDLSAAVTVTVNFEEIPLQYTVVFGDSEGTNAISDFSNTSFVIPSGVTLNNIQGNVYGSDSNKAVWIRFGKSGATGSFDATIGSEYVIKKVVANIKYYSSDSTAKFAVTPDGGSAITKTMTNSFADYVFDIYSSYTNKVTLGSTTNGKRVFLSGFTIEYEVKTNRGTIEHTQSASALKFNYTNIDDIYSFTNTTIRFGGFVSTTQWNQLHTDYTIQGYGVLVASNSDLGGQTLKQKYAASKTNNNTPEEAIVAMCTASGGTIGRKIVKNKAHPAEATPAQKTFMGVDSGDYYIWTVQKSIGDAFTSKFNAVAFILIDGDIVFLQEVSLTAKEIATRDVTAHPEDPALPALTYMKDH